MIQYVLRRLATSAIVVLGVSVITFIILHGMSGSPGRAILGVQASAEAVAAFNRENGYDDSIVVQYFSYLGKLLHGDLGYSYKLNQSVNALLAENAGRTAMLAGVALLLAIVIAVPLGVFQAVKRNSVGDNVVTTLTFVAYSMPVFLFAMLLIQVFALGLGILPAQASQSSSTFVIFTEPRAMLLPVLTLTGVTVALYSRYQRSAALDQLAQDYIRVARAKGLSTRMVLTRHLLRNACLPLVTLIGMTIPLLLAGNLVVESVFNYPGLGLLFFNSLNNQDYPVLLGYTLVASTLTVLGNLLADLLVAASDPRTQRA
ncbi:ABC transporter permease [Streptosporangium sp. NBC_01639]|uniref:ABC transporter permease n=1 Tax=unclassified Streptosporangium TaxID=2632669 RepID=UPI002DD7AF5B|nr:ABC transporter permease [Streptosporangium sp. NBC_01756]WSC88268.1 ABC transporter permease [Streptosporangium sp. NBC_01756]WTD53033.1 ABC transporter permease [Streptosporangium sp. NBC_01639]